MGRHIESRGLYPVPPPPYPIGYKNPNPEMVKLMKPWTLHDALTMALEEDWTARFVRELPPTTRWGEVQGQLHSFLRAGEDGQVMINTGDTPSISFGEFWDQYRNRSGWKHLAFHINPHPDHDFKLDVGSIDLISTEGAYINFNVGGSPSKDIQAVTVPYIPLLGIRSADDGNIYLTPRSYAIEEHYTFLPTSGIIIPFDVMLQQLPIA